MHNLTPLSEFSVAGLLPYLLLTSLVIFVFMMVVMIFFYGLSIADIHRKMKIILRNFFFISASVSILILGYFYYYYSSSTHIYKVYDIEKNKTDHKVWLDFKTSQALFVYIEYNNFEKGTFEEILPLNGPGKKTNHSFMISIGKQGGKVSLIIDSKKFLIDGKPIMIE